MNKLNELLDSVHCMCMRMFFNDAVGTAQFAVDFALSSETVVYFRFVMERTLESVYFWVYDID